jgi:hypothetical protein
MPKNVMCKNCNNYRCDWCEKVIDSPDPNMPRTCQYFCERTNADRIRAMSDEELADFITSQNRGICTDVCREMYYQSNLKWLKQPAEGE